MLKLRLAGRRYRRSQNYKVRRTEWFGYAYMHVLVLFFKTFFNHFPGTRKSEESELGIRETFFFFFFLTLSSPYKNESVFHFVVKSKHIK